MLQSYEGLWEQQEQSSQLTWQVLGRFSLGVEDVSAKPYVFVCSARGEANMSSLVSCHEHGPQVCKKAQWKGTQKGRNAATLSKSILEAKEKSVTNHLHCCC